MTFNESVWGELRGGDDNGDSGEDNSTRLAPRDFIFTFWDITLLIYK